MESAQLTALRSKGRSRPAGPGIANPVGWGRSVGHWRVLGVEDGLPPINAYTMLQDRGGGIWFGTDQRLARFDGRQITLSARYTFDVDVDSFYWIE